MEDSHENQIEDTHEEQVEDNILCDICMDGEVYENNEILFCDKCNVAVHQLCYGVKKIPKGSWFCYVCERDQDPKQTTCELCSFTGGAFKPTDKKGKWAHGLCASWIPELFERHSDKEPPTWQTQHLDKRRFNLRCGLCKTKGACVQCSYGRCTTAVHPWCALRTDQGYTRRIIKDEDNDVHWEIFCKTHAKAVSEPVKPKSNKNKNRAEAHAFEQDNVDFDDYWSADQNVPQSTSSSKQKVKKSETAKQQGIVNGASTSSSAPTSVLPIEDQPILQGISDAVNTINLHSDVMVQEDEEDEEDDDKPSGLAGAGQEHSGSSFAMPSFLEWPGLSEGEAMDLIHFWNYTSSFFAEDHTKEWYEYMKSGALSTFPAYDERSLFEPSHELKTANPSELSEALEEAIDSFSSERERSTALYYEKRNRLLDEVARSIDILEGVNSADATSSAKKTDDGQAAGSWGGLSGVKASKLFALYQHHRFTYDDEALLLSEPSSSSVTLSDNVDDSMTENMLKVAFDGSQRLGASFVVKEAPSDGTAIDIPNNDGHAMRKFLLKTNAHAEESNGEVSSTKKLMLELLEFHPLSEDSSLNLRNEATIASKIEPSIISRIIRTDCRAYDSLVQTIQKRLERIVAAADADGRGGIEVDRYEESHAIHTTYVKQQVWKWICSSLQKGIRDQRPGFNKQEEIVPASWAIAAPGRPSAPKEEDDKEPHEDVVCMCCFDGTYSEDVNQILFCDGCNATVHQKCYGIAEVPEGNYYCDRCLYLQKNFRSDEVDEAFLKNAVRCCLCPLYHGGLKRTTDKRWVHMSCALWAGSSGATIGNLTKMAAIDIKQVPLQSSMPIQMGRPQTSRQSSWQPQQTVTSDVCLYCRVRGGYVVSCSHVEGSENEDDESVKCGAKFHPICAWFAGSYMCADITDPTFQGATRDGQYPSGVQFTFLCSKHDSVRRENPVSDRAEQVSLRSKYRVNEDDLTVMPGKGGRRKVRRSRAKNASAGEGNGGGRGRQTAAAAAVQKELPPDVYSDKLCCVCMQPTLHDIFGTGYDSGLMTTTAVLDLGTPASVANILTESSVTAGEDGSVAGSSLNQTVVKEESSMDVGDVKQEGQQVTESILNGTLGCAPASPIKSKGGVTENLPSTPSTNAVAAVKSPNITVDLTSSSAISSDTVICQGCHLVAHVHCVQNFSPSFDPVAHKESWLCATCTTGQEIASVDCALCPRHGGLFFPANDGILVHGYCARTLTTTIAVDPETARLDLRHFAKDVNRKQRCGICNRKKGLCVPCSEVGCGCFFHPICGTRSGKGFLRTRGGIREAFCQEHLPVGLEMSSTGYWLDGFEFNRLRYSLDRGRLVLDLLLKREKFKKLLCKTEMDLFAVRYQKAFQRATGRRIQGADEATLDLLAQHEDNIHMNGYDDEDGSGSDYVSDDDAEDIAFHLANADEFVLLDRFPKAGLKMVKVNFAHPSTGESLSISATWTKLGELRTPRTIKCHFAGHTIHKRDAMSAGGVKTFVRAQLEKIHRIEDETRLATMLFAGRKDEDSFAKKLSLQVTSQLAMSDKDFLASLKDFEWITVPKAPPKPKSVPAAVAPTSAAKSGTKGGNSRVKQESDDAMDVVADVNEKGRKRRASSVDEDLGFSSSAKKKSKQTPQQLQQQQYNQEYHDISTIQHSAGYIDFHKHFTAAFISSNSGSRNKVGRPSRAAKASESIEVHTSSTAGITFGSGEQSGFNAVWSQFVSPALASMPTPAITKREHLVYPPDTRFQLERVLFYLLDNLDLVSDEHPETLQLILENRELRKSASATSVGKAKTSNRGRPRKNAAPKEDKVNVNDEDDIFMLVDDYKGIPYDDIPDYDIFVRRSVCLDDMRDTLQGHGYSSFAQFASDFYTLMNNARGIATMSNTKIRDNTKRLVDLFEMYRKQLWQPNSDVLPLRYQQQGSGVLVQTSLTKKQEGDSSVSSTPSGRSTRRAHSCSSSSVQAVPEEEDASGENMVVNIACSACHELFEVRNWPARFRVPVHLQTSTADVVKMEAISENDDTDEVIATPSRQSSRRNAPAIATPSSVTKSVAKGKKEHQETWQCKNCVASSGEGLLGQKVAVWWRHDACSYPGHIDAYDAPSNTHRVLYEDNEWEFLMLGLEPYLFLN